MSTEITTLNASEKFNHVLGFLESEAQSSLVKIQKYIKLPTVDIVFSPCSDEYRTERGILGCVSSPDVIDILLDTERHDLNDIINNELTSTIAHELHHVIRASSGVQDKTLLQVLITEGLACHFETKFNGKTTPNFLYEVKKHDWRDLYSRMQDNLEDTDINYPEYFGVKETSKFPKRAGYWVGFNLVSEYINKYGGCAVTLVNIPAEELVVL